MHLLKNKSWNKKSPSVDVHGKLSHHQCSAKHFESKALEERLLFFLWDQRFPPPQMNSIPLQCRQWNRSFKLLLPKGLFLFYVYTKEALLGPRPHSKSTELTERPSLNNITTSWLNTKRCIGKDVDFEIIGLLQIGVPHLLLWYLKQWMV